MTAREAIALTQAALMKKVNEKIEVYANDGKHQVHCPDLPKYAVDELLAQGFVIRGDFIIWES